MINLEKILNGQRHSHNDKESGIKLNDKFKAKLLKELKKQDGFDDLTAEELEEHLNMIYNIDDKGVIISPRTELDLNDIKIL